jgi:endonuclease YncB( thermonuclease family)
MRGVALFCLAPLTTAVPAAAFTARVASCHDGDTCRLETGQGIVMVRLAEIDAPRATSPMAPKRALRSAR